MATLTTDRLGVPPHVRTDLVWREPLDRFAERGSDPYSALAELHEDRRDLVWAHGIALGSSGWLPVSYRAQEEVLLNADLFSSDDAYDTEALLGKGFRQLPLEVDAPRHGPLRRVLHPAFLPSAIAMLSNRIRQVARDLIAAVADRGAGEFRADFATPFPSLVFCELMGLPKDDLPRFLAWQHQYARDPDPARRMAALQTIRAYLHELAEERRRGPRDDLASLIVAAEIKGQPLTTDEIMGLCITLYLGGLDTVASSLGWYFKHLAEHPDLQDRLRRDPASIPGAVDEFLRAFGIVTLFRTVSRDAGFHGAQLRRGDRVYVVTPLASRDPRRYDRPHEIDPDRRDRHLTLATGPHSCLGVHLAKAEIRIALEEWLSSCGNIRINDADETIAWSGGMVWTVERLPLRWDPSGV